MPVDLEWGPNGLRTLAPGSGIVVIVDVLSFTTVVDLAVGRGAVVLPYRWHDGAEQAYAATHDAEIGPLSPTAMASAPTGARLVIPSPNGSALSFGAAEAGAATVVSACLRNAPAVGAWIAERAEPDERVAVIPAGERWRGATGPLRPAFEDLVGAGAVIDALGELALAPEARAARAAFRDAAPDLAGLLHTCPSGREKRDRGEAGDVELAAAHGVSTAVPVLDGVAFVDAGEWLTGGGPRWPAVTPGGSRP